MEYIGTPAEVKAAITAAATEFRTKAQAILTPYRQAIAYLNDAGIPADAVVKVEVTGDAFAVWTKESDPLPLCAGCSVETCERCL